MKNYFRLYPYCRFVYTKHNACIYNFATGDMINVNDQYKELLISCEVKKNIITNEQEQQLSKLQEMKLGDYYESNPYIQPFDCGVNETFDDTIKYNNKLTRVFLELTNQCDLSCIFCGDDENRANRRTSCSKWRINQPVITTQKRLSLIDEISKLGCEQLIITGGNPLLNSSEMLLLIKHGTKAGIHKFILFLNGSLISKEILDSLKDYNITINLFIVADNDEDGYRITKSRNYYSNLAKAINLLNQHNISYYSTVIVGAFNENIIPSIINTLKEITNNGLIQIEYIYPLKKNDMSSTIFFENAINPKRNWNNIDVIKISNNMKYHNCFYQSIAITADGEIIPCIMTRNISYGNVQNKTIAEILNSDKYYEFSHLTKDKIEPCSQCAYKYGCFDCRAIQDYEHNKMLFCKTAIQINQQANQMGE